MGNYVITPLNLGTITRDKSMMAYMTGPGVKVELPVFAWYVTDGKEKILVDTGGITPDGARFMPYRQDKDQEIGQALKNIGVACEEIETVLLTHLHWDHASQNHLFHTDLIETYRSFNKVERLGAKLLIAHEPSVLEHRIYPPED